MASSRPTLVATVAVGSVLVGMLQAYDEVNLGHGLDFYSITAELLGYSKYYLMASTLIPIGLWLASAFGLWLGQPWGWWLSAFHYLLGVARHLESIYFDVFVLQIHLNPDRIASTGLGGTLIALVIFIALVAFAYRLDVRRWAGVQGTPLPRLVGIPFLAACFCAGLSTIYEVASKRTNWVP